MNESLVATVLGEDRAGLVESIARVVSGHGGNWVESRMSRLAGRFAGILRVDVGAERAPALADALRGLASSGLTVVVEPAVGADRPTDARRLKLELVGQDRPGIVREISGVLVRHGVSVDELQTECSSAPESGGTLFRAAASLHVPASVATLDLRNALERIADDLMVDVVLEEPGRAARA
jgi:glycine cleavage system regulatory protein